MQMSLIAGGDDEEEDEGEEGEEKMPTCGDYIMHFLTLIWKVIFAIIPPAGTSVTQLKHSRARLGEGTSSCFSIPNRNSKAMEHEIYVQLFLYEIPSRKQFKGPPPQAI